MAQVLLLGKEIHLFFASYGIFGIYGMMLSCLLTGLIVYHAFVLIEQNDIKNYSEFLELLFNKKHHLIVKIIYSVIHLFLLISFFIMVAGFGAYFYQEFHLSTFIGAILIALACYLVFNNNVGGIVKINSLLIPLLILIILIFGIKNLNFIHHISIVDHLQLKENGIWFIDSILYSSYNSIILIPILISLKNYLKGKKSILTISFYTILILFVLSIVIFSLLLRITIPIVQIEIPMMYVANTLGFLPKIIYGTIILIAIFTSAISAGYSFLQMFEKQKFYRLLSAFICILAVLISNIGFSQLVNLLYPIFGYLGILQILALLLKKKGKTDIN